MNGSIRLILYCLLLTTWLMDLNSNTLTRWIAPEFVEHAHVMKESIDRINLLPFWQLDELPEGPNGESGIRQAGNQMLELDRQFHVWTFRGAAIRFLNTPVSPSNLLDRGAWRAWLQNAGTMVGVGKIVMIASFYFFLPMAFMDLLSLFRGESFDKDALELVWLGPFYVAIGAGLFPCVAILFDMAINVESPLWRFVSVVLMAIVGFFAWLIRLLGAKLIGTFLLILALPFSLLHGFVFWLISIAI